MKTQMTSWLGPMTNKKENKMDERIDSANEATPEENVESDGAVDPEEGGGDDKETFGSG